MAKVNKAFRFGEYDHCAWSFDECLQSGIHLDSVLAELTGGYESPEAEAERTVKRWGQEATSSEWNVRLKRE